MEKLTWSQVCDRMWKFNEEHNIRVKGGGDKNDVIHAVVVFTTDSFEVPYTETERSYRFSNHNKAFIANQCSNSIFADCLDGKDDCVRLDWYMHGKDAWEVEYCYFEES